MYGKWIWPAWGFTYRGLPDNPPGQSKPQQPRSKLPVGPGRWTRWRSCWSQSRTSSRSYWLTGVYWHLQPNQQVITQVDVHVLTLQSVLKNTVKHHNLHKHWQTHTSISIINRSLKNRQHHASISFVLHTQLVDSGLDQKKHWLNHRQVKPVKDM